MKYLLPLFLITSLAINAQTKTKLVVGLVVDQMRYEFIYRYWDRYEEGGFKKLVNEGYNFKNAHYNYIPTYTGPGHSSIFTGTTPATHGIISNSWYDKKLDRYRYCVEDSTVQTVGEKSEEGKMSPRTQLSTTIGDELKLATANKAKVIGIALKDRSAVLPAGHAADGAYWMSGSGNWISSSFYVKKLPSWVEKFNASKRVATLLSQNWNTLFEVDTYSNSLSDENHFEGPYAGLKKAVFPYDLKKLSDNGRKASLIKATPFGNTITREFAQEAIIHEGLGQDEIVDLLTVSFSSIDYIGHQFGPHSIEMEDAMLRLDRELAIFIQFLDEKVGKGSYTLFLTADHGSVAVPAHLMEMKIPAGYEDHGKVKEDLNELLFQKFQVKNLVKNYSNYQVFLDKEMILQKGIDFNLIYLEVENYFLKKKGVHEVLNRRQLLDTDYLEGIKAKAQNGYHPSLSGDIWVILQPGWISYSKTGTTHGSAFSYDTHIPLLWYGNGIPHGENTETVNITDIAPSVSNLINISQTNGNSGVVLSFD